MPEENQANIPYFVHEGTVARMERIINRLTRTIVLVLAISIILFIINNLIWMRYIEKQQPVQEIGVVADGVYQQPDPNAD